MKAANSESAPVRHKRDRDSTASDNVPVRTSVFKKHGKRQKLAVGKTGEITYSTAQTNVEVIEISSDEQEKQRHSERDEPENLKTPSNDTHDNHNSHRYDYTYLRSPSPTSRFSRKHQASPYVSDRRVFVSAHQKCYDVVYPQLAKKHNDELLGLIHDYIEKKDSVSSFFDDTSDEERECGPSDSNKGNRHTGERSNHPHGHDDNDNVNVSSQSKHVEERVRRGSPDYGPETNHVISTTVHAMNVPEVHDYDNAHYNDDRAHSQYRYETERSRCRSHGYDEENYDTHHIDNDVWHEKDPHDSFHHHHHLRHEDWREYDRRDAFYGSRHTDHDDWYERDCRDSFHDHRYARDEDWEKQDRRVSFYNTRHSFDEEWHEQDRREYFHNHPVENERRHYHARDRDAYRYDEDDYGDYHRGNDGSDYYRRGYERAFHHEEDDYYYNEPRDDETHYAINDSRRVRRSSLSSTAHDSPPSPVDATNLPHLLMGTVGSPPTRIFVPAPNNAALAIEHHEFAILISCARETQNLINIVAARRRTICYDLARYVGRLLSKGLRSAVPLANYQTQRDHSHDPVKFVLGYISREAQQDALWVLQQDRPYLICERNKLGLSAWKLEGIMKLGEGTANVKMCEREYRGYQAGLEEAEEIEGMLDGVM